MRIDGRSLLSLTAISATRIPLSADHDSLRSTPTVRFRHRHLDFHGWHAPPMFSLACKRRECFRGRAQCPNERATQWYANRELRHVIVAYFAWQISSTLRLPSRFQWPASANENPSRSPNTTAFGLLNSAHLYYCHTRSRCWPQS